MTKEPELAISEIPETACPFCGQHILRAAHVPDAVTPGMLALCPYCKEVVEMGPALKLSKPSEEKLATMKPKAYKVARELLAGKRRVRLRIPR
jgi:hypothetical protein